MRDSDGGYSNPTITEEEEEKDEIKEKGAKGRPKISSFPSKSGKTADSVSYKPRNSDVRISFGKGAYSRPEAKSGGLAQAPGLASGVERHQAEGRRVPQNKYIPPIDDEPSRCRICCQRLEKHLFITSVILLLKKRASFIHPKS